MGSGSSAAANAAKKPGDKGRSKKGNRRNDDGKLSDNSETVSSDDEYYEDENQERKQNRQKSKKPEEEREELLDELKAISNKMVKSPPDKIPLSQTYQTSYAKFQKLLKSPNREVLHKLFEKELWALRQHTAGEVIAAEQNKSKTTRDTIISEYKLKVCALVNCYREVKQNVDEERLRIEREKFEDMKFLSGLHDQVAGGDMPRWRLVLHMDNYGNVFRAKQERLKGNSKAGTDDGRSTATSRLRDRDDDDSVMSSSHVGSRRVQRTPSEVSMNISDDYKRRRAAKRLGSIDSL